MTLKQVKQQIYDDPQYWATHLMDFVDDFRYYRDEQLLAEPFVLNDERMDALLAATAEQLCYELKLPVPQLIQVVPAVREPWFVSGVENLKAISLVESPLPFRMRKLFVLETFSCASDLSNPTFVERTMPQSAPQEN